VTGTRRLNSNYAQPHRHSHEEASRNRLLESLQLLQLNPLIQNLSAELSVGRVLVQVLAVTEAKSDSIQVVLDNGRVPSVGSLTPTYKPMNSTS